MRGVRSACRPMRLKEESTAHVLEYHVTTGTAGEVDDHRQPDKKKRPRGVAPGPVLPRPHHLLLQQPHSRVSLVGRQRGVPSLARGLSLAHESRAFLSSAERGAWSSWLRGAWSSWLRGAWSSWLRGA